jgi:hypothetical protein
LKNLVEMRMDLEMSKEIFGDKKQDFVIYILITIIWLSYLIIYCTISLY